MEILKQIGFSPEDGGTGFESSAARCTGGPIGSFAAGGSGIGFTIEVLIISEIYVSTFHIINRLFVGYSYSEQNILTATLLDSLIESCSGSSNILL